MYTQRSIVMAPRLPERVVIDALRGGAPARVVVRGGSMWPAVRDGALVEITPTPWRALAPGDLAAFVRRDQLVVHRVVSAHREGLRCQGDALAHDDGLVAPADVLGVARVLAQPPLRLRAPTLAEASRWLRGVARRWVARRARG